MENLFQEGFSMFRMEQNSDRGISWVDNLFHKFGVIYKEVDDTKLFKETGKFVECRMQTVGENLRNFCAEIMQEFLTPPSDHPTKEPLTDLSLNYGEDIANYGKAKEGLEEFSPLVEDMPGPMEKVASTDVAKGQMPDFSVDEITEVAIHGARKSHCAPPPKDLRFQHNGNTDLIEASLCLKCCLDHSSSSAHLLEKATSQKIASELASASCPEEPEIRIFSTESAMDIAYSIIKEPEHTHLLQDDFIADSSGFTIISNCVESDESTSCKEGTETRGFLKKKETRRCAKQVEDDEYEQVAYWDNTEIDVELKQRKATSYINQRDDSCVGEFANFDSCESEWELL